MSRRVEVRDAPGREDGVMLASDAIRRGEVIVLPTDTVYGVGADAFDRNAVRAVLAAKGRGRDMPPPVLVANPRVLDGLARDIPAYARELVDAFWPGGLTLVCRAQPSLDWDLGDNGTVAVRMPLHRTALALLDRTGPLAVTSANRTGEPAATTCAEAEEQLGEAVSVYLDGGPCAGSLASTILDVTGEQARVLRVGALELARLRTVLPDLADLADLAEPAG
ncbi:MAG: L-threonylcarbamoyladenylate synthase [Actinomycetota bacterium]|nr:L-threonylcarbamoyladenylate synthase [Actinomycetota bacterium]